MTRWWSGITVNHAAFTLNVLGLFTIITIVQLQFPVRGPQTFINSFSFFTIVSSSVFTVSRHRPLMVFLSISSRPSPQGRSAEVFAFIDASCSLPIVCILYVQLPMSLLVNNPLRMVAMSPKSTEGFIKLAYVNCVSVFVVCGWLLRKYYTLNSASLISLSLSKTVNVSNV